MKSVWINCTFFLSGIFLFVSCAMAQDNKQISNRIEQSFTIEKTRKDIRIVGDGTIAKPQIKLEEKIIRLPAAPSATAQKIEAMRRKEALDKLEERQYKRPLILSAGTFQSGDNIVQLANIKPTNVDQICQSEKGDWPCGRFAKAAFQRLVRSNSIICVSPEGLQKTENHIIETSCWASNFELAKWLITQGWVDNSAKNISNADHIKLRDAAKENGLGIWRK